MKICIFVLTTLFFVTDNVTANQLSTPKLILKNMTIIDPQREESYLGNIVVENNRIQQIIKNSESSQIQFKNAKEIDLSGKYVMPGFMDLHMHNWGDNTPGIEGPAHDYVTQEEMGHRMLIAGITSYLDLFAPNDYGDDPASTYGGAYTAYNANIFKLRRNVQQGLIIQPNTYVSGPLFVVEKGHSVAGSPDAITLKVRDRNDQLLPADQLASVMSDTKFKVRSLIQAREPDVIKFVYDSHKDSPFTGSRLDMPLELAKTIIQEAKAQGVKTVAHVGSWKAVEDLANAGVSAFTHLPGEEAPQSTIQALLNNNTSVITTISIYSDSGHLFEETNRNDFLNNALLARIAPHNLISSYLDPLKYDKSYFDFVLWADQKNRINSQSRAIKSLYDGRVKIISGSDSGNFGTFIGYSVHRDLLLMSEAGLRNWDVLKTTTINAGEFLNVQRGKIETGYLADFVILDKNPIIDIRNTQSVSGVVLNGKMIDLNSFNLSL